MNRAVPKYLNDKSATPVSQLIIKSLIELCCYIISLPDADNRALRYSLYTSVFYKRFMNDLFSTSQSFESMCCEANGHRDV